jgi:hypothetical protein
MLIVKTCPNCRAEYDLIGFRELPLVGVQEFDQEPSKLELRNCPCINTTVGVWLDKRGNYYEE